MSPVPAPLFGRTRSGKTGFQIEGSDLIKFIREDRLRPASSGPVHIPRIRYMNAKFVSPVFRLWCRKRAFKYGTKLSSIMIIVWITVGDGMSFSDLCRLTNSTHHPKMLAFLICSLLCSSFSVKSRNVRGTIRPRFNLPLDTLYWMHWKY